MEPDPNEIDRQHTYIKELRERDYIRKHLGVNTGGKLMTRLDHFVVNIDHDLEKLKRLKKQIEPLGYPPVLG